MKYSQFNTILPFDGQFVLYNSFHNRIIILEETLKDILQAARFEGIDSLLDVHPDFYNYLADQEFLVDEQVDEINRVREISQRVDEDPSQYLLTINPTMNCNFKCWYCYETHVKNSSLTPEQINRINKFILKTAERPELKHFGLSFFGGEPLLYFSRDVTPIIDHFHRVCNEHGLDYSISFTSNGYLIDQDFIDYFDRLNIRCSLQITFDGYGKTHDQVRYVNENKGSFDQIVKNIKLLVKNRFPVRLRINYTESNLEETWRIAEEFSDISQADRDAYMEFDYHRVWQNDKVDDAHLVLDRNVDSMRESGFKVSGKYSPNNVHDSCYADKRNSVVINYNGDLFKCTARDFTKVQRAGVLSEEGELVWENEYQEKRMNVKFNNKPCLSCRIMPLCNGGCSQHALEHLNGDDYCVYFGDEGEKDKVVKSKIEEILHAVPAE